MPAQWSIRQRFEAPPTEGNRSILEVAPGVTLTETLVAFASPNGILSGMLTDFRTPLLVAIDHNPDPETAVRVEVRG